MCLAFLKKNNPSRVEFLFDSPISHSADLAARIRDMMAEGGLKGNARVDKNPDALLIKQSRGIVVTSDSDILNNTEQPIVDLAHLILADNFELQLPDLGTLLA